MPAQPEAWLSAGDLLREERDSGSADGEIWTAACRQDGHGEREQEARVRPSPGQQPYGQRDEHRREVGEQRRVGHGREHDRAVPQRQVAGEADAGGSQRPAVAPARGLHERGGVRRGRGAATQRA